MLYSGNGKCQGLHYSYDVTRRKSNLATRLALEPETTYLTQNIRNHKVRSKKLTTKYIILSLLMMHNDVNHVRCLLGGIQSSSVALSALLKIMS